MDSSFNELTARLEHLPADAAHLGDWLRCAIAISDVDPEMSLTRVRKVLEFMVRDVYAHRIKEPPGTRPLDNLLTRIAKDGHIPKLLAAYANTVRDLGNIGTHSFDDQISACDIQQSLAQLLPIVEWYLSLDFVRTAAGTLKASPPPRREINLACATAPVAGSFSTRVIPKGLRSFDDHDSEFFLQLLPGARDQNGVPEAIRFWKQRIESTTELTFTVGVIYGPSGCGKSSMVKAGLLPRLAPHVVPVYVEAADEQTETRLLNRLRKRCPGVSAGLDLRETLTALGQGTGLAAGQKVIIVLDQFEQWLHAKRGQSNSQLVQALRQCDGQHCQAIVMVRDDFWLAVSRFLGELEIRLTEGENMALVDLFDPLHARKVLTLFGRAFGRLNEEPAVLTAEQASFLDQAVAGLSQENRIISVRLALFAEMVKGRPWTPDTLRAVGGMDGIGVTFLEETFSAATAPAEHRLHQQAARKVLEALLPEEGTDIKGHMLASHKLLAASGYGPQPEAFVSLLHILDTELRLVTPTDPEGFPANDWSQSQAVDVGVGEKYFQLTHDYLVKALREWLYRKERESARGRAKLRLNRLEKVWRAQPMNQYLPRWWEWLNIVLLARRRDWTAEQRTMMRKANAYHVRWTCGLLLLLVALSWGAFEGFGNLQASALVRTLTSSEIDEVPLIVSEMSNYRRWTDTRLRQIETTADDSSKEQLHARLALVDSEPRLVEPLRRKLLAAEPQQVAVIRQFLRPYQKQLNFWDDVTNATTGGQRLRAACALADFEPHNSRWEQVARRVVDDLLQENPIYLPRWLENFEPVSAKLVPPLTDVFHKSNKSVELALTASALAEYLKDRGDALSDLAMDARLEQNATLLPGLQEHREQTVQQLQRELSKPVPKDCDDRDHLAFRQANAAVILFQLGQKEPLWPLLRSDPEYNPDPTRRTLLLHAISQLGTDPEPFIARLQNESDVTVRRVLVLCLGGYSGDQLPVGRREALVSQLLKWYHDDPDPGVHSAINWLLRPKADGPSPRKLDWGQSSEIARRDLELAASSALDKSWYVNSQQQTLAIINASGVYRMGAPKEEPGGELEEDIHYVRICRRYAIATTLVTNQQFDEFLKNHESISQQYKGRRVEKFSPDSDSPALYVTWYQAAQYCRWLSEQEHVHEDQMCYPDVATIQECKEKKVSLPLPVNVLERTGYRLPTEAEWEYACRAGSETIWHFGNSRAMLPYYAWFLANSPENGDPRAWPVGQKKPNDFGLFDVHGNAWELCFNEKLPYPLAPKDDPADDPSPAGPILFDHSYAIRGGSFLYGPNTTRAALRSKYTPGETGSTVGFRVARTMPP